jgi:flagellar export protein FliJ
MAKFVFKLAPVLKQRLAAERQRQAAVAVLESRRVELEDQLRAFQRGLEEAREAWREMLSGGSVGAADIRGAGMQAVASLAGQARAQRVVVQLAGVHANLAKARAELAQAMKARRAIELLREKQYEEWRADERRRDAAAMDEIAARMMLSRNPLTAAPDAGSTP